MIAQPQIKLFGAPSVTVAGQPMTGFISNKAVAVIYFVAATGQPQAREVLATLLWTNSTDAYAKKNLRNVLSNLRDLLGDAVEITRETVTLSPTLMAGVDGRRFLALLKEAEQMPTASQRRALLAAAVDLYQGAFLDGFQLPDAEAFDEWLRGEREHFALLAMQALHELVADSGQQGKLFEGISYATRLLKMDPLREETYRHLMLLLALDGQRDAALAHYRACQKLLQSELGVAPDPETEQLYQRIQAGEFRKTRPAPLAIPTRTPRVVLPAEMSSFVGRATELMQVQQRLMDPACRLLTIIGMGGVGKTRLALRVGHALANDLPQGQTELYPDGIYFIPLAALEPNAQLEHQLPTTIAALLQIPLSGAATPALQLAQAFYAKTLLLILDNCEHLPMATFLSPLLQQTQRLQCLVTARSRLNLPGEQLFQLGGLTLPDQSHTRQGEANPPSDAVRLFAQSAQAADVHFTLDQTTHPWVTQICQLLHGLPLGIELAASWLRFLTLAEIAQEITQNLNFLDTGLDALPDQQRSLRAVFMHSWRLLAGVEQQTLRRLAVFRGGFTRAAAQQVAGATLPLLAALGDKSLLQRNDPIPAPGGGSTTGQLQYRLHTVIHQYAAEQLALAQETAAYQQRHALYMLDLLAAQQTDLNSARQQTALALIDSEIENLRAAWQWLLDQWQTDPATLVASPTQISQGIESLFHFYDMRSWFQEGEAFFGQLAQQLGAFAASQPAATAPNNGGLRQSAEQLAAKAQARQGWFAFHLGRHAESRRLLETSLQRLQQIQALTETIFNLNYLGALLRHLGEFAQATTHLQAALQLAQQHNDPMNTSIALNILGQVASLQGDLPEAQRLCQQAIQIKRAIGDRWGMTFSLTYLGRVLQSSGDYAAAQKHFAESLAICQELGDQRGAAFALQNLGDTAFARGDLATASQRYQASLAIYHAIGNRAEQSLTLARLGETYRAGGELDQARQALLDALALAWALPSTPGLLAALLGLAALDLTVGQPAQATPLLHYVYQHPTSTPQQRQQAAQLLASAGADSDEPLAADDEALTRYVERVLSQLQAPASLDL